MNRTQLAILMSLCGLLACECAHVDAAEQAYDGKTLAQVERIYNLSENAARERLAKEYVAATQARHVQALQFSGYAGVWFDATTQNLWVADTNQADFNVIRRIGATPVLVDHSLAELETARQSIGKALASTIGAGSVRESYVDVKANAVVLGIDAGKITKVAKYLATAHTSVPVRLTSVAANVGFSANLRGADGTQNYTWKLTYTGTFPCSVGATAEMVTGSSYVSGFATAGHCGSTSPVLDIIQTSAGSNLGTVEQSTFDITTYSFANNEDGAWVSTYAGWVPQPQVNGYTDGILTVSGTWSGLLDAPTGTTACRYGEASQGPHCGTISARSVTACLDYCGPDDQFDPIYIQGLIKINGICTDDGDSGGTLKTPSGQMQGTVTGGTRNSCPDSSGDYVYFQPIKTTLTRAKLVLGSPVVLLTAHGRSTPTVSGFRCPDPNNSGAYNGYHVFTCNFVDYDSQGPISVSWTTSTGASSGSDEVSDNCTVPGPMVSVTLAVTNVYGTSYKNRSFSCPTHPIP